MRTVSVIVATYKRSEELRDALESLSAQSYKNIEIILVDDNSDAEWNRKVSQIVNAFLSNHAGIRLVHIVNPTHQGSANTRNIGVRAAQGEYVTFLDDDDVYLPDKVSNQVGFMERGGYDYSITDLDLYNEAGKLIDRRVRKYIKKTDPDSLRQYHLRYHMTGTDTMMFKRTYILEIGGFPPIDVGDEFYLMERAIDGGGSFGYLHGCDVKAYVHTGEGGLSSGDGKIKGENALYEYKKTFFGKLDGETRRYIRMRHYAVVAFAELRRRRYGACALNAVQSFLSAPLACVKLFAVQIL